ncbi:MAG: septation protein A [Alphaproteobacteria bacterium]
MADPASEKRKPPRWLGPATEYGPLVVFFAAYLLSDLFVATAAVMIATVAALIFSWVVARTLPKLPLAMAPILLVLGGLTLYLEDDTFIKIRPTIVNGLLSVVMIGSVLLGRQPLRFLMSSALNLNETGWTKLTFRFGCLFAFLAVMNEIVWRTQTDDFWVTYKVFGALGITMTFMMTQIPMISRHTVPEDSDAGDRK